MSSSTRPARKAPANGPSATPSKWACRLSVIGAAVEARILCSIKDERVAASESLPGPSPKPFTGDKAQMIDAVRDALYASKIICYAQGFVQLGAAAKLYNWILNFGDIASIWRGGCIIRAQFLNRITDAYRANPP